ncbi:hypothetical protein HOLleu_09287 [Holothuria leucospilota]|uniref:Uncharacterized protein n=1 Tax=Holothuria leucospilota TaxID=206669 RepID=A0A9Q1CJK9_HOLLE|nr:hypothetical protein HOLleu_09287 [Holothuria leucospilota]
MLHEGDIDEKTAEYLVPKDCETSRYYTLPKTHKAPDTSGHLKIRPVISGIGSPIERLSEFLDFFINPEVQKLDSFIKDSKDMVKVIEGVNEKGPLPPSTALFTIDVKAMYPSLPQYLSIKGVRKSLDSRQLKKPSTDYLLECLKLCRTENHFEFNGRFLLRYTVPR